MRISFFKSFTGGNFGKQFPGFLEAVGKIGAPTGVIAIFCQVLDVPSRTTAIISLAAICVISICLWRSAINARVPSALLMALLVVLAALFFANYQNILLKNTGLIRYYKRSADIQSDLASQLAGAHEEIWFFGTDFHISAIDQRSVLLKKLTEGVKIRYLVYNPFSSQLGELAQDFDQSQSELRSECLNGLRSLIELRKRWQQAYNNTSRPGELEIRLFDSTPRMRVYVIDPGRSTGQSFLVPYINRVNSPDLPGFQLQNIETGVYADYFAGVRKQWQASLDIDEVIKSHPEVSNP